MASANSSLNTSEHPRITKDALFIAVDEYPNILALFKIVFGDLKDDFKFTYDNSKKALGDKEDSFFKITEPKAGEYNLDNIAEWYESKNPEYKSVSEVAFNVPEFNFILAVMLKDLVLLSTTTYPIRDLKNTVVSSSDGTITFNLSGEKIIC